MKDTTSHCKILSDTANNTNEIVKLVKFSPKRENLLGQIKSNIEMEDEEERISASGLTKFCATRWTLRAICFQRVIDNYDALLKLWNDCLETRLESDVRGRIIGCRAQMKKFYFFFGLNLSQRIFSHTDNLSETLQKAGMSSTSGQHNASLTKDALKKNRNDDCFATFYQTVLRKKQLHVSITEPQVPRNKRAPGRFEVGTGTPLFPVIPEQVYRRIYFEALDLIVSSIEERFDQRPSFKAYSNMESLLKGVLSSQDVSSQMDYMKENYVDDVRTGYLFSQLEILKVLINDAQINCFADVLKAVKSLTDHERHMITEFIVICKLLLVNPATSATGERSFSMARRVNTWLRANMKQQRFNNVALLPHTHKERTDKIRLLDVANEFVQRNVNRFRNFS